MDEMNDILRLVKKCEANSHYPIYIPNVFYIHDKKIAEAIAKCGKRQIRKLVKNFKSK